MIILECSSNLLRPQGKQMAKTKQQTHTRSRPLLLRIVTAHANLHATSCNVLQFSRRDDLQNTGLDPAIENRRIVWICILRLRKARRRVAF